MKNFDISSIKEEDIRNVVMFLRDNEIETREQFKKVLYAANLNLSPDRIQDLTNMYLFMKYFEQDE